MNIIDNFVKKYENRSINTVKNYRSQLNQYFNYLKVDPDTYFDNGHDYKQDIRKYWDNKIKHRPPLVRTYILSVINSFLRRMGSIDIEKDTPYFWQELKDEVKGKRAITEDHVPSSDELKKILIHANAMEKAIFLIASSSGMRIGEIIQLTEDDIKTNENPCRIHIPGNITKNGEMRDTFVTNEAKEAYLQWMNVRKDYLCHIEGKLNFPQVKGKYRRDKDDPRVFPITYVTCSLRWNKLLKNAKIIDKETKKGYDKNTGRIKLHIHCLR
ncbi:MAG: tyrosine-type recombinase/integrase, partial [Thermoplasmatales archaeon]|nr:tyrosine-type recombinase/integrase [Thermoplasmatales archaeon]